MKKLFFIPLLLIFIFAAGGVWFYKNIQPVSSNQDYKDFLITRGASASQIGSKLESSGFIKSALAFKIYTQFTGKAGGIQTGEFRLTSSFTLFQTVDQLLRGPTELWVVIPEGLRREEIAAKFTTGLDRDASFTAEFLDASRYVEGTLFPDTYLFAKDVKADSVVNKMTRTFSAKTNNLAASSTLSFDQRVVLASIIERETKTAQERPIVAGILLNRIGIGMPLQVDAAVQYAVASAKCKNQPIGCSWWIPLTRDDLAINSPYNTYKFAGLPPGPISNPGESSLEAAFNPSETDFLYYIHDKEGQIHYAKTLAEHNTNIAKYLGK
jgi:UPF0755 protein